MTTVAMEGSSFMSLSSTGTLTVTGSKLAETITVESVRQNRVRVTVALNNGSLSPHVREYSVNVVKRVRVYGANGADTIRMDAALRGISVLSGGRGDDTIISRVSDTTLSGDAGNDTLVSDPNVYSERFTGMVGPAYTQAGISQTRNQLFGGPGADVLRSRGGDDSISGGTGNDRFEALNNIEQSYQPLTPFYYMASDTWHVANRARIIDIEVSALVQNPGVLDVKVVQNSIRLTPLPDDASNLLP